jgi:hypothetical protein
VVRRRDITMKTTAILSALSVFLLAPLAMAQGAPAVDAGATSADTTSSTPEKKERGAFVAGGKFGGVATLSGFGPNITGALEVGYILPWYKRSFGVLVDVSYAVPVASGSEPDPRVPSGKYEWTLYQKQLAVLPMVTYRYTGFKKIVPFVGVGPRIVMLESVTEGKAGSVQILETTEQSTKVGVGAPIGAAYLNGPGGALAELLFQYNPIDHESSGSAGLTSFTLWLGYRFML